MVLYSIPKKNLDTTNLPLLKTVKKIAIFSFCSHCLCDHGKVYK